tara:strand:+ start:939 stop:1523 length:585 start_codon:yes stop_codon:yes gene_type:complete
MTKDDTALYSSLVQALAEMANPKKIAKNPFFKSKYATLEDTLAIASDTLAKYDLAVMQLNVSRETDTVLVTRIIHKSGAFLEDGGVPLKLKDQNDAQKLGSAITYARRYGLQSMLGMCGEDDDGNTAVAPPPTVKITHKQESFTDKINGASSLDGLEYLWDNNQDRIDTLSDSRKQTLTMQYNKKKKELENANV